MSERIISFRLRTETPDSDAVKDWYADDLFNYDDEPIGLCDSGLRDYVQIPVGCERIDLILSDNAESGHSFEILENTDGGHGVYYEVDTLANVHFFGGVRELMGEFYHDGYRWIRFEHTG